MNLPPVLSAAMSCQHSASRSWLCPSPSPYVIADSQTHALSLRRDPYHAAMRQKGTLLKHQLHSKSQAAAGRPGQKGVTRLNLPEETEQPIIYAPEETRHGVD
jgi:hypothetical protein